MIMLQPFGVLFARFSPIVEDFTHVGLTRSEAADLLADDLGRRAVEQALTDAEERCKREGSAQWYTCLDILERVHGPARLAAVKEEATKPHTAAIEEILNALLELSPEDRLAVVSQFCRGCGTDDSGCQCTNDD